MNKISISQGNIKMGAIPSISLPAGPTCRACSHCQKYCYAKRMERRFKCVRETWARNLAIYEEDSKAYFEQINEYLQHTLVKYFRWHVGGDIPEDAYFAGMLIVASNNPDVTFLCFTKKYEIVNRWADQIPDNLKIIFSADAGLVMDNPHNLPEAHIIFKGTEEIPQDWKLCGGNCTECACRGLGCWQLRKGEKVAFHEH